MMPSVRRRRCHARRPDRRPSAPRLSSIDAASVHGPAAWIFSGRRSRHRPRRVRRDPVGERPPCAGRPPRAVDESPSRGLEIDGEIEQETRTPADDVGAWAASGRLGEIGQPEPVPVDEQVAHGDDRLRTSVPRPGPMPLARRHGAGRAATKRSTEEGTRPTDHGAACGTPAVVTSGTTPHQTPIGPSGHPVRRCASSSASCRR